VAAHGVALSCRTGGATCQLDCCTRSRAVSSARLRGSAVRQSVAAAKSLAGKAARRLSVDFGRTAVWRSHCMRGTRPSPRNAACQCSHGRGCEVTGISSAPLRASTPAHGTGPPLPPKFTCRRCRRAPAAKRGCPGVGNVPGWSTAPLDGLRFSLR
jgi:hypothetical protein